MIYVLVPAYNEAPTVGLLLWKVRQLFTSFNREYQLIVVNDGSTDATDEILAPYTRALPLTLLSHRTRQGYARSLEVLLREAVKRTDRPKRDLAVTLQADFSESPDEILELIKKLEGGADIVVADRRRRTGATRMERFARGTLARLASRRLGIAGADDLVGTMRGYRLGTIQRLIREHGDQPFLSHQGWAADIELLARAARHARSIESVPIAGARTEAARPSRLRPVVEAWRAWRASGALRGLPRPVVTDGFVPAEEADRPELAHRKAEPPQEGRRDRRDRPRHERPRGRPAAERGREERSEEPRGERKQESRPERPQGERSERRGRRGGRGRKGTQKSPAAEGKPALEIVPPSPDESPNDAVESAGGSAPSDAGAGEVTASGGDNARKRRRRRGRGRGRGRGQGPNQQGQSAPLPPPPAPPAA